MADQVNGLLIFKGSFGCSIYYTYGCLLNILYLVSNFFLLLFLPKLTTVSIIVGVVLEFHYLSFLIQPYGEVKI